RTMRQLYLLGSMCRMLGDYAGARELFAEAAELQEPGDPWAWSWQWNFPADLATDERRYDEAARLYRTDLCHFEQMGYLPGVGLDVQRMGILGIRMGDPRRGVRLLAGAHDYGQTVAVHYPELLHERRAALDRARSALKVEAFEEAWAAGRALTLEEAAAEALSVASLPEVPSMGDAPSAVRGRSPR